MIEVYWCFILLQGLSTGLFLLYQGCQLPYSYQSNTLYCMPNLEKKYNQVKPLGDKANHLNLNDKAWILDIEFGLCLSSNDVKAKYCILQALYCMVLICYGSQMEIKCVIISGKVLVGDIEGFLVNVL